ncbi:probable E3 ubiquitin-protein ligase ARI7 [Xiphophorus hellerii]|uniref:probable E3 ubiquitin-protein ligase ARI7 n=1 Tax=Xiphophorus hellerii TaxID=8084 RepID=UPI0013B44B6B|nr:probable E3 ubiquitin-protein ligase ARI7 [Xiphophorus hellerii]XP_032439415.1 probable E3 ubiquitin-protein ligase ARI7 [Xiphophorus hellerii]
MTTQGHEEKRYDRRDTTLKFVNRPDALDPMPPDEGDQGLRAEMSCGHAVTPQSLTGWCRSLLDQGQYKFKCPALKDGTHHKCDALWSYQEVRRLAVLTAAEMQHFEENMARLAATEYCDFKTCPGCSSYIEREDLTNLCVQCLVCTADKNEQVQFCWQCLMPWKGPAPRSDRCDNNGCINHDLELLRTCKTTSFLEVVGVVGCPSIRACPTCGHKVEHDKTGCKNIICPRCQVEFCFVCLELTPDCLETSDYFSPCSAGVAPRQTSIPVWHRN